MNEVSIEWIAGLFEGEGCITVARQAPRRSHRNWNAHHATLLTMGNTDRNLLLPLWRRFGGTIREFVPANGSQRAWMWRLSGGPASSALEDMLPHMVGRKGEQAKVAIELEEHKENLNRGDVHKEDELAWREACKQHVTELGRGEPV